MDRNGRRDRSSAGQHAHVFARLTARSSTRTA
jgi:hypothetical protein